MPWGQKRLWSFLQGLTSPSNDGVSTEKGHGRKPRDVLCLRGWHDLGIRPSASNPQVPSLLSFQEGGADACWIVEPHGCASCGAKPSPFGRSWDVFVTFMNMICGARYVGVRFCECQGGDFVRSGKNALVFARRRTRKTRCVLFPCSFSLR